MRAVSEITRELRLERPIDPRIPRHWRDRFVAFTGTQPRYSEYAENPDLWEPDHDMPHRMLAVAALIGAIAIVVGILS